MHHIRQATPSDAPAISALLTQLGYPGTSDFLPQKLIKMLEHPDEILLVAEMEDQVIAFISFHIIPQIALPGDFARISYFAVDAHARSLGVGKAMEEYCAALAQTRQCDRIEVHCHSRRTDAHRFYFRQGYEESPKYLIKKLRD
ncbi:GNAT family N-acetyltransferase [Haliscomenobacter sp.]|uniref:GNAT family N-acetyltransferase n=1 Tax=Haliscomenobacter sp. TaxID=2717303 RepID=UPI003BAB0F67